MIDREMVGSILGRYLNGEISQEALGQWAYGMLAEYQCADDLVEEVMYNLVSLHQVGWIFDQYRPDQEKLQNFYTLLQQNPIEPQ